MQFLRANALYGVIWAFTANINIENRMKIRMRQEFQMKPEQQQQQQKQFSYKLPKFLRNTKLFQRIVLMSFPFLCHFLFFLLFVYIYMYIFWFSVFGFWFQSIIKFHKLCGACKYATEIAKATRQQYQVKATPTQYLPHSPDVLMPFYRLPGECLGVCRLSCG